MSSTPTSPRPAAWWLACRQPAVWSRAARLGLVVGVVQVSLNQGDHWLSGHVTTGVVIKSILSPLLSFAIAFISAAATHAETLNRTAP
jgi:phosphate/sulfate permease